MWGTQIFCLLTTDWYTHTSINKLNNIYFCRLVFEFTATGGIITSSNIKTQRLLDYNTHVDYFMLLSRTAFVIFTVYYMCLEFYEMYHFRTNYFKLFWNWIDLILVVVSIYILGCDKQALIFRLNFTIDFYNYSSMFSKLCMNLLLW